MLLRAPIILLLDPLRRHLGSIEFAIQSVRPLTPYLLSTLLGGGGGEARGTISIPSLLNVPKDANYVANIIIAMLVTSAS